jgi:hypothetical protein
MTILYNCHHAGDQYRITKFDSEMNPQGSYLVTREECDCPAGLRRTCRHRNMLHDFLERQHIGDEWFLDYDRGGWVQMGPEHAQQEDTTDIMIELADNPPEGVTALDREMTKALEADGEKLRQLTGEDHGPWDLPEEATLTYSTDEPPLEITHVELFVDAPQPAPKHIKRRL